MIVNINYWEPDLDYHYGDVVEFMGTAYILRTNHTNPVRNVLPVFHQGNVELDNIITSMFKGIELKFNDDVEGGVWHQI